MFNLLPFYLFRHVVCDIILHLVSEGKLLGEIVNDWCYAGISSYSSPSDYIEEGKTHTSDHRILVLHHGNLSVRILFYLLQGTERRGHEEKVMVPVVTCR